MMRSQTVGRSLRDSKTLSTHGFCPGFEVWPTGHVSVPMMDPKSTRETKSVTVTL